jgi:phosphotransferase system HPr (HPr) family protein
MDGPLRRVVTIANPNGLHLRAAAAFAERAGRFQCAVALCREGQQVNGKDPWDILLLAAEQGTKLVVEATGSDAAAAVQALGEWLESTPPDESAVYRNGPNSKSDSPHSS